MLDKIKLKLEPTPFRLRDVLRLRKAQKPFRGSTLDNKEKS